MQSTFTSYSTREPDVKGATLSVVRDLAELEERDRVVSTHPHRSTRTSLALDRAVDVLSGQQQLAVPPRRLWHSATGWPHRSTWLRRLVLVRVRRVQLDPVAGQHIRRSAVWRRQPRRSWRAWWVWFEWWAGGRVGYGWGLRQPVWRRRGPAGLDGRRIGNAGSQAQLPPGVLVWRRRGAGELVLVRSSCVPASRLTMLPCAAAGRVDSSAGHGGRARMGLAGEADLRLGLARDPVRRWQPLRWTGQVRRGFRVLSPLR